MKKFFAILIFAAMAGGLFSQPAGTLDLTFNGTGTVVFNRDMHDIYQDVKVQPDGKIVAVGNSISPTWSVAIEVTRFLPDGSFDPSFGDGGHYNYDVNYENMAYKCLILDDGKILVCGHTTDYTTYSMLLIRLDENGVPDPAFGNNGIVLGGVGTGEQSAFAMALQDDGKILLSGYALNADFRNAPVVVRFTDNGTPDHSFGTNGVATVPVTEIDNDFSAISIQSDGKILAAGHISNGLSWFSLLIARFDGNGIIDGTYGTAGVVNINLNNVDDEFYDMQLLDNDESVLTGFTVTQADLHFNLLVMKFDTAGHPVTSFGNDGAVIWGTVPYTFGDALALQSDGKILVAGSTGDLLPGNNDWAMWRFNTDGTPDNDFGTNGVVTTEFSGNGDEALGIALYEDKIVMAGKARNADQQLDFAVARYINDFNVTIPEMDRLTEASVSPNPVKAGNMISVSYNEAIDAAVSISLTDLTGHSVQMAQAAGRKAGKQSLKIRIPEQVQPGIYFLKISEGSTSTVRKLLVTK